MNTYDAVVERYLTVWNETDPGRRRALIAQLWTEDAQYHDPVMEGVGHTGIDALVQGAQQQFPSYRFRRVGQVDGHHRYVRFAWELGPADGPAPIAGSDVAVLADDGRLQRVIGFLDRVPAGAPEVEGGQ
jgi:hypothetical protein